MTPEESTICNKNKSHTNSTTPAGVEQSCHLKFDTNGVNYEQLLK